MAKDDKKDDTDNGFIQAKVFSPYQTYYEGPAVSISAENDTGPFDILPKHHNFITLINDGEVVVRVEKEDNKRFRITKGILHARKNKVTVFLDV